MGIHDFVIGYIPSNTSPALHRVLTTCILFHSIEKVWSVLENYQIVIINPNTGMFRSVLKRSVVI